MKALEILKNASSIKGFSEMQLIISKDKLAEAIKELEALTIQETTKNKFKIGDWVVYTGGGYCDGEILQITDIDEKGFCTFGNYNKLYHFDKLRLWKPKPGEWCWVYDRTDEIPVLGKFAGIVNESKTNWEESIIASFRYVVEIKNKRKNESTIPYRYIEPFIGSLPSIIT